MSQKRMLLLDGGTCNPDGNKGDELMLHAVLKGLERRSDRFDLVGRVEAGPFVERAKLGLCQLLWERRLSRLSGWIGYPMLRRFGRPFGIVADEDLDAVINFMGYRYADFGARELHGDNRRNRARRKRGTKLIFLPQAYGPFADSKVKDEALELFGNADLIYARDERSAHYLRTLGVRTDVLVSPDITIPMAGENPSYPLPSEFIAIIPNRWMVDRVRKEVANSYVGFLQSAGDWALANGLSVVILSHAQFQDELLVTALQKGLPGNGSVSVIQEKDPLVTKGLIGRASVVIGSRYHALVAGLSQSVPTIGTSWAHKYEGLFKDYRCEEHLLDPTMDIRSVHRHLDGLLISRSREALVAALQASNEVLVRQVDAMWEHVMGVLDAARASA